MDAVQSESIENLDNGCDVSALRKLTFATLDSIKEEREKVAIK